MKENMSFEQAAGRVEEILAQLEKGDVPLEKALSLYEEGAKLTALCQSLLEKAEQRVVKLSQGNGGAVTTQAFAPEE